MRSACVTAAALMSAWACVTGRAIRVAMVAAPAPELSASGGASGLAGPHGAAQAAGLLVDVGQGVGGDGQQVVGGRVGAGGQLVDVGHLRRREVADRGDVGLVAAGLVAAEQLLGARVGGGVEGVDGLGDQVGVGRALGLQRTDLLETGGGLAEQGLALARRR